MSQYNKKQYALTFINKVYEYIPEFNEVFDEETFYIFVFWFIAITIVTVIILSRYITLKPVD